MLADRFKLVMHREKKEVAVYALTVAKGGIKLKPRRIAPWWFRMCRKKQLGLRLDLRKAPMDILVVDRAERSPTPN